MNRVDRLLGYLLVFQSHDLVRAQDLATRFEVSERTVYRDIEALYEVGVPLVGMPGEGYQLMPGYYLPPVMFSAGEAQALFLAIGLLTGLAEPGPTLAAAQAALDKLRVILPKATLAQIEALQAVIGFYNLGRHRLDLDNPTLHQLQQAIQEQRVVILRYHAQHNNQITERSVEPLQLAYLDNVWVLTAWCRLRQAQRSFRLDRIDQLTVTRELFPDRTVQPREVAETGMAAVIWVSEESVRWVREAQYFAFVREETVEAKGICMHYRVRDPDKFIRWLLQWGENVEILTPTPLRAAMKEHLLAMVARYVEDNRSHA
ncbi:MAG: YafY family transcriptional regulator [Caldilineaceae bacterium]|nr:YafY family transcriptional regulator [Caldilineaceae bacterium]